MVPAPSMRIVPGGAPTPGEWRGGRAMYFRFVLYPAAPRRRRYGAEAAPCTFGSYCTRRRPDAGGMARGPRHVLSVRFVPGGAPTPEVWRGGRAMYFRFVLYPAAPRRRGNGAGAAPCTFGSACTFRFGFVAGGAPTPGGMARGPRHVLSVRFVLLGSVCSRRRPDAGGAKLSHRTAEGEWTRWCPGPVRCPSEYGRCSVGRFRAPSTTPVPRLCRFPWW